MPCGTPGEAPRRWQRPSRARSNWRSAWAPSAFSSGQSGGGGLVCNTTGDYGGSVRLAEQFGAISRPDSGSRTRGHRGPHDGTRPAFPRRTDPLPRVRGASAQAPEHGQQICSQQRVPVRPAASAHSPCSRVRLGSEGSSTRARRHAEAAVSEGLACGHTLSLCYALANGAAPAVFWSGDFETAERYTDILVERSAEQSLELWQAFGTGYRVLLDMRKARAASDESLVASLRSELSKPAIGTLLLETLCTIDHELATEKLLSRAENGASGWCAAELLRVKALHVLRAGGAGSSGGSRTPPPPGSQHCKAARGTLVGAPLLHASLVHLGVVWAPGRGACAHGRGYCLA